MIYQDENGTVYVKRKSDIAAFFGIGSRRVNYWQADGAPIQPPKYYLADIAKWAIQDFEAKLDGDDKSLKILREERTEVVRIQRRQMEGSLIPLENVRETFTKIAQMHRTIGEQLARQFGDDAHDILQRAMDTMVEEAAQMETKAHKKAAILQAKVNGQKKTTTVAVRSDK
jgi:phage terminase Nu1 subunit (DNA packaging protein)